MPHINNLKKLSSALVLAKKKDVLEVDKQISLLKKEKNSVSELAFSTKCLDVVYDTPIYAIGAFAEANLQKIAEIERSIEIADQAKKKKLRALQDAVKKNHIIKNIFK